MFPTAPAQESVRLRVLAAALAFQVALVAFPHPVAAQAAQASQAIHGDRVQPRSRSFRTFLPQPGRPAQEPKGRVVQLLLDRQVKEGEESYLVQVLFRGLPAKDRHHRVLEDRVEIDFYDAGKPSMRPARIRGGVVEASSLEEFHYLDGRTLKTGVRLTVFTHARPALKFRSTLDRTIIHFRIPLPENEVPGLPSIPKAVDIQAR